MITVLALVVCSALDCALVTSLKEHVAKIALENQNGEQIQAHGISNLRFLWQSKLRIALTLSRLRRTLLTRAALDSNPHQSLRV